MDKDAGTIIEVDTLADLLHRTGARLDDAQLDRLIHAMVLQRVSAHQLTTLIDRLLGYLPSDRGACARFLTSKRVLSSLYLLVRWARHSRYGLQTLLYGLDAVTDPASQPVAGHHRADVELVLEGGPPTIDAFDRTFVSLLLPRSGDPDQSVYEACLTAAASVAAGASSRPPH